MIDNFFNYYWIKNNYKYFESNFEELVNKDLFFFKNKNLLYNNEINKLILYSWAIRFK